jgi:serine/threonine-protein kinase
MSADGPTVDVRLMDFLEELTRRIEAGEPVDVDQVAREHPDWADDIRELLPALRGLAELGIESGGERDSQRDNTVSRAGRTYGDFRIIREIGRGGMGIVYEAEQVELGRRVALKVLPLAASLDPRALQRFRLEAQVAGWLQHPRIVPVIGVGSVDDVPYYAMQYIERGQPGRPDRRAA